MKLVVNLLLVMFSAGWLYPLAGLILIPAGLVQEHLEQSTQQIVSRTSVATAIEPHHRVALAAPDARDAEFHSSPAAKRKQIEPQLHAIGELRICAIVMCVWLAAVVACWSWKLNRVLSVRSHS